MKVQTARIIDALSTKYEFFYIAKKHKWKALTLIVLFYVFIAHVWYVIQTDQSAYIYSSVFPLFIDIGILALVALALLSARVLYNEESMRIIDDGENRTIPESLKIYLNTDCDNVRVTINPNAFFKFPELMETLLRWVNFDKEDFFRTHYGALDIPKLRLEQISGHSNKEITLSLGYCSFYDISFSHYFADFELSNSRTSDSTRNFSLRSLLKKDIERHYMTQRFHASDLQVISSSLVPNHIGITGIVSITYKNSLGEDVEIYVLQVRNKTDAAAKGRLQWSFAGTIDALPEFYSNSTPSLKQLVDTELFDELLNQNKWSFISKRQNSPDILERPFSLLKEGDFRYKAIGLLFNPLYLYQPELFVHVCVNTSNAETINCLEYFRETHSRDLCHAKLLLLDMQTIKDIFNGSRETDFKFRNLFQHGLSFFEKSRIGK